MPADEKKIKDMDREPILTETMGRFCIYPLKYPDTWHLYQKQVASFWTVSEVDLAQDRIDYDKLSADERAFVGMVLAFFAASDGVVNENLASNFASEVQVPEIRQFYGFQIGMETIHAHMYGLMIETFERDEATRLRLFRAIEDIPSIKSKSEWALKWIGDDRNRAPFAHRLVAFACVEGIFFSASFCAIYFFKKRGKMPGLTFSNELIARDEGMHRDFACHVYTQFLVHKLDQEVVHEIVRSAVDCERMFVHDALRVDLIGMNATLMQQYVEFVADHLALSLGYAPIYETPNPFDWMDLISLTGKANFFEKRVGEYQKAGVMASSTVGPEARKFALDADF